MSAIEKTDLLLFTPGPLTTSRKVKEALLTDKGSRDTDFIRSISNIQSKLLDLLELPNENEYCSVLLQGSGTFGLEAALNTFLPRKSPNVLILSNGRYGERVAQILRLMSIDFTLWEFSEKHSIKLSDVLRNCEENDFLPDTYTNVWLVHLETTIGVLNEVGEIGQWIKRMMPNAIYMIDGMSSIGAVNLDDNTKSSFDVLISSANKCIQGVPGFSFIITKKDLLLNCKGNSRSLSFDLTDQYLYMEKTGCFRFTPPVQVIMAFECALNELFDEGGCVGRMKQIAPSNEQGWVITTFHYPNNNFDFQSFYERLKERKIVIYPGKLTSVNSFRLGNIGDLHEDDIEYLVRSIKEVMEDM
ncbi:hypothetical protein SNEBB_000467 [Seison nebaliae]|nr:hypothetical protein SNEBB_000467 [Seison nebaliae]